MKAKIALFVIFFLLISLAVFSEPERITTTKEGSQQVREFYAIRSDPNMQIGGDRDKDRRRIADEFLRLQCPCNIEGISYAISFGFTCIGNDVYEEFESTFPYPNSNDCVRCPLEGTYQFVPHYVKFMKKCDPDKCVYGKCIKESVKDKQEKDPPEPPPPPSTKNVVSTDIISECGDGIIQPGEDCDDGSSVFDDLKNDVMKSLVGIPSVKDLEGEEYTNAINFYLNNRYKEELKKLEEAKFTCNKRQICWQCKCEDTTMINEYPSNYIYLNNYCGDGILQNKYEECDVSAGLDGDLCPDGKKCKECKCVDEMVNDYDKTNRFGDLDIPRTYSLFLSGGGLLNSFLMKIFKQTLTIPGFKFDSYKIFTDFAKNDPFTITTNFAQKYPKGALINLQQNKEGNYVPQINNYASNLENTGPAILIKPLTDDGDSYKNEKQTEVYGAKIILRNLDINREDITFIANNNIWSSLVQFVETSDAFQRLDANNWPAFVNILNENFYDAGVKLVQTPYTISTTGIPLEENTDYKFTVSRLNENSFTIQTTLLNNKNPENSVIIATVKDKSDNPVINFEPRTLTSEEIYTDNKLYEEFGSGSFTVDIEIITQQKENSFDSFINRIEQRILPSRFDDIVYSALG